MDEGVEVIVVTSGAIASGLGLLNVRKKNRSLSHLQAMASIGQNHLMDIYNDFFTERGYRAGQILLTQEDFNDRRRFLNIRYTINALFEFNAIPLINENDCVSTEEIKCGDNDRISALLADLVSSDMLIILSDVEGLLDVSGKAIAEVQNVDQDLSKLCSGKGCAESTGGMATKLNAIKNATESGIECFIADGRKSDIVKRVVRYRDVGTRFFARERSINARKRWLAYTKKAKGSISVDNGAKKALLEKKRSLLPGGVVASEGFFSQGDLVEIVDESGVVIAKGLSNYTSLELDRIKGKKSSAIEKTLGYKDYDEVVHRDNLVTVKAE